MVMKKHNFILILFAVLGISLSSCEDILDQAPLDRYSDATVWTDVNLADAYLKNAYRRIYHGFNANVTVNSISDELFFIHIYGTDVYVQGNITADNQGTFGHSTRFRTVNWSLFNNVQVINVFLANIDNVVNEYPQAQQAAIKVKTDRMKGEALLLRAWCYSQMCRTYGGLPIIDSPSKIGDDFLEIKRGTFEETINFIVDDCDAAAALLGSKSTMEKGRATNATALALKSRMLLFAASDLTADGTAESEYVGYKTPNRTALWTAAKNAAKAVIDLNQNQLANFGSTKAEVSKNYFDFFKATNLNNTEVIWGKMFVADVGDRHRNNRQQGPNGLNCYGSNNPTQAMVDAYQMEDGSDFFDHFYVDANGYYKNKGTTKYRHESPYYNREARFYASILCDSSLWQKRFANLAPLDPLGIYDRRTRITVKGGAETGKRYGLDTRNGPIENWNAGYTGYLVKKMMDDTKTYNDYNTNIWIYLRYAEVLLNYAEACMESGDNETAATYINMIRQRSALPDFTGDIEAALRHERQVELFYEDLRWYDIRRWKILESTLTDAKGMDIVEVKNQDNGSVTTTWQLIHVQERKPVKKIYWIPIPNEEMKKAPQLVQNPGY